ncbi:MAG TPA: XdhC/CoxI family protein [Thermoanaerobaculia bacterium]|nr:XdhC/CoxI family protein [Thermoanaerobaculia bacterium]
MSHETFELMDRLRRDGSRAAMATLVRTAGTTPRKEGTKMFVGDGGSIFGSVTIGGCVDARVIEHSGEVLKASSPRLLSLQLGDEEAWEIGLSCGGAVDVLVEPLTEPTVQLYAIARSEWQAGRSVGLATVIAGDEVGAHLLIDADGKVRGSARAELAETLAREVPRMLGSSATSRTMTYGSSDVYIEILRAPATLVVFGAGAVAIPLVAFATALGFQTVVVDGRPRFASRDRFPDAGEIRVGIPSAVAEELKLGRTTPVVLLAHDYKIDLPVLKRALAGDAPYIGLLGSRRRGAAILQMLREDGVPEAQLDRVRVPVGLDLGGETAAEIALSIVAEIVAVMHGRNGAALGGKRP